jgi:PHD/YefM family antitoxin component YafN of YafNO toxin-antitoxin module
MQTIPAREIKRRGIGAVDPLLDEGPVYVIRHDRPAYVIVTPERFAELVAAEDEQYRARVRDSLNDLAAGRVRHGGAADLLAELAE